MSNKVNKYLAQARENSQSGRSFKNADGRFDDATERGSSGFSNFAGNGMYRAASGANPNIPTSQPYIIVVTSASGAAVDNFEILGSNAYLYGGTGTWTADGSLQIGSITISSGMPNVTYREMLAQFQAQPFKVGLTYYQSATTGQVNKTLQIVTKDANGNEAKMPLVPTTDPYQFQAGIIPMYNNYVVDGFVKMVIQQVLANSTITFQIYPADKVNTAAALENVSAQRAYSDPQIVKSQPVVVK